MADRPTLADAVAAKLGIADAPPEPAAYDLVRPDGSTRRLTHPLAVLNAKNAGYRVRPAQDKHNTEGDQK